MQRVCTTPCLHSLETKCSTLLFRHTPLLRILALSPKPSPAHSGFLSACQTATGDKVHFDETIHIAAGMLFTVTGESLVREFPEDGKARDGCRGTTNSVVVREQRTEVLVGKRETYIRVN